MEGITTKITMLKKFFISMLGTMAGLWLSLIILFFGSFFVITMLLAKNIDTSKITDKQILYIDLTGNVSDREYEPTLSDIMNMMDENTDDLESILASIRLASDDKNVKGIYINCGGSSLGIASRSEVIEALQNFKKSGKWVYAYADNFEQGDYYIASAANEIYLNPVGGLNVHGLSATVMFYKDVLEKLGIGIDVVRVGSFKSAVEPYLRMDMSPESRMQMEVYLNSIWDEVTGTIAQNRGISSKEINIWADSLAFTWAPERYVDCKAITKLCYRSEVEKKLKGLLSIKSDDELPLVTPSEYLTLKPEAKGNPEKDHVAVLYAVGEIYDSGMEGIVSETMVPQIQKLAEDKHVKGLVLRVNSPGGSAFASEQIWHALEDFKAAGKPFYVSMGDYAASGGYYISCGADVIYSDAATLTGSIGIFGVIPNAENLIQKKIGLGIETVETNKNATFPSLYTAPTSEQVAKMQTYVERGYDTFTSRVAQGRSIPVDSVKAIGGGRVWDGQTALKIGLVDKIGSLNTTIQDMVKDCGLKMGDVVSYPELDNSVLMTLLRESRKNVEISIEGMTPEEIRQYIEAVNRIKNMSPLQARMEGVIIK